MAKKGLTETFCNVKVNGYIYGVSDNCNSLLTYKWKVLSKEIQVSRLNREFGGPKVTTIILTCKLVEYNGREEHSSYEYRFGFNAKEKISSLGDRLIFPNKERYINWLKQLEDMYKYNLNKVQSVIKNQIQR